MDHLRQKIKIFRLLDKTLDLLLIILSIRFAIIFERILHSSPWYQLDSNSFNIIVLPFLLLIWYYLIKYNESDYLYRITPYKNYFTSVLFVTFLGLSTLISIKFLIKYDLFYRSTIVFFGCASFILLFLKRVFLKTILNKIRSYGIDQKHILIIGWDHKCKDLINQFEKNIEFGIVVKHIIDPLKISKKEYFKSIPISTDLNNLENIILNNAIDEVFITNSSKKNNTLNNIFSLLNACGVNYHVMVDSLGLKVDNDKLRIDPILGYFYGIPTISYHAIKADLYSLYIKNFLEKIFAFIILILSSPCIIIFSFLIKINSNGNIFFKQERIGLHGRKFYAIKLRTMINDAEDEKKKLLKLNELDGPAFKMENDPRVTLIGRFLRKYSFDELPQLINVIRGEMNLIGPRPLPVSEVKNMNDKSFLRRHSMKPGITGLWQVNGRTDVKNFDNWIKLDLEYIDNWSLWLDLKIAIKTIPTIIKGSGK